MRTSRRQFLTAASAAVLTARRGFTYSSTEERAVIHSASEVGLIRPELHGHFAEHLGSCTYGGLWVGKGSRIPNLNGFRKAAVDYLKAVGIPVLRWPGGCFADDYHWRDGIGQKRPKTVNIHWGNYTEDNSFGTHEFIGLCRLIGAEPYLAGNVGSGTPQELRDWVEYCNYPSGSALSDERIANGAHDPFKVKYWGVGNENWGCGGQMMPEEYSGHYRRFSNYIKPFGDTRPFLIACGPSGNDANWTNKFMEAMGRRRMPNGFAMHFYSNGRATPTKFTDDNLREQLSSFAKVEAAIKEQRELLDKFDPQHRIGLMVDEWGVWDRMIPEEEKKYGRLWMQITQRSAVAAGLGLNAFHRQADKLVMCNIAQIVNVLHSLLLTEGDKCIRTSTYYLHDMMKLHRSKQSLKLEAGDGSPLGLSVSASRKERDLVITAINPKPDAGMNIACTIEGGRASAVTARLLYHADKNACNTFDRPNEIVPKEHAVRVEGGGLRFELPPLGIVSVIVKLS